jgi:O-methyltransferase
MANGIDNFRYATHLVPDIDALPTRQKINFPEIIDPDFWPLYETAKKYSMVHVTGFYNTYQSIRYIADNRIAGDIVECGCFFGGMAIFIALLCNQLGIWKRIVLFDTFEGPPIGSQSEVLGRPEKIDYKLPNYLAAVLANIAEAGLPTDQFELVPGLVENTIPGTQIGSLSLLRLDTDFYSSTKIELEYLYPHLSPGGVLIVDDYGFYQGSRSATDEYLATLASKPLLNRIDIGVWAGVKP